MTCIVGLVHATGVTLGCDSICANFESGYRYTSKVAKLFRLTATAPGFPSVEMVVGFTSHFRMGDILRTMTDLPHPLDLDPSLYLITKFVPAVRAAFTAAGYTMRICDREEAGDFLIAIRGRLFVVQGDFSVIESAEGYGSVGIGYPYAMASVATTEGMDMTPEERIRKALHVAARHNAFVAGPFHLEELAG